MPLSLTEVTDLTLAAPQVAEGGREGAEEHGIWSGDTVQTSPPQRVQN